jgi:hypothetical protein
MRVTSPAVIIVITAALGVPSLAVAQEPVKSFDQLNTRLKIGDTVYVTDAQGREIKGRIEAIGNDALTLKNVVSSWLGSGKVQVVAAADVREVRHGKRDSLVNGTLVGLGVGALGGMLLGAEQNDFSSEEAAFGALVFGGLGAIGGLGVDYAIGHYRVLVYRAPGASGSARLSIGPVITPRMKGVAVSLSF